jgi:hypothetical protein
VAADTRTLIDTVVRRFLAEVPALANLKLVCGLELRGRGDVQLYRVELPGPKITKDVATDARIRVSIPRADFNQLVAEGGVRRWREAFETGHARAEGSQQILRLIAQVVERQEERARTRRARR